MSRQRKRSQKYSRTIGTKPFSGRRFVEHGVVRIEWWPPVRVLVAGAPKVVKQRRARTIGPNTEENRTYADQVLEQALAKARAEAEGRPQPDELTIGELLRRYREDAALRRSRRTGKPLRPVTLGNYDRTIASLREAFDPGRPAASLRRVEVRTLMQRLRARGLAEGTIARLLDFLEMAYKWAVVEAELLHANPVHGIRRPSRKRQVPVFTPDEARKLWTALRSVLTWGAHPKGGGLRNETAAWRFRGMMTLQAAYAPRASQVRFLRWDDVDLDAPVQLRAPGGEATLLLGTVTFPADTEGSKGQPTRTLPMLPAVREALLEAFNNNRGVGSPWVFPNWRDPRRPMSDDGPRRSLHDLCQRAGVPRAKGQAWHALRHALMTVLVEELGPSQAAAWTADTVQVITGTYVKPSEQAKAEAAAAVGRRLA